MNVKEAIEKRRSIRKYQKKEVPETVLKDLIDAARLAPSGNNAQPSRFVIIRDMERLKKAEMFKQPFVYTASAVIVCCADPEAYTEIKGKDDYNNVRAIRDLGIASSFIVLRATELGLGTCFVGWVRKEKLKKMLKLPERYVLPYVIVVGYADEEPEQRPRKEMDEVLLKVE